MKENWDGTNVVLDIGWGDNGKGKFVDYLAKDADMVVRWAGGANAGHTVVNQYGEFKFHLMPSGIFEAERCVLGKGVALDPFILIQEMKELHERGFEDIDEKLLVSLDAHMVMPWHKMRDGLQESGGSSQRLGTTKQGMGPLYADRTARHGLQMHNLFEGNFEDIFMKEFIYQSRLTRAMRGDALVSDLREGMSKREIMQMARKELENSPYDAAAILFQLDEAREILRPMAQEVIPIIRQAHEEKQRIVGEGNQGVLLGLEDGTYPYVSSSDPTITGFEKNTKIKRREIKTVLGITKAYTTRVGEGPMPTELHDEMGDQIRTVGREYGTTTGRPRRTGWFDAVSAAYGAHASGADEMGITKIDVLDGLDEVQICVAYQIDGQYVAAGKMYDMPARILEKATPVYETMPGWQVDTTGIKTFEDLPREAQAYVHRIEQLVDMHARFVSVGPHREQTIERPWK